MKKYGKYLYDLLIYGSIIFVVVYLFRTEDFNFSGIRNYGYFFLSIVFTLGGFVVQTRNWHGFLKAYGIDVPWRTAFVSIGLTIFGKYIPGKVWLIIGRSGYVIKFKPDKAHILHISSTYIQMLWTFTGVAVGAMFIPFAPIDPRISLVVSIALAIFIILIFIPGFQSFCYRMIGKIMKKVIDVPILGSKTLLKLLPQFFLHWMTFGVGFLFLVLSMGGNFSDWPTAFGFVLATNMSYFMIFLPGGIGFRESLIYGFLVMMKFDESIALSISVMSRVLYTLAELLFFVWAFLWKYLLRNEDKRLIEEGARTAEINAVAETPNAV